MSGRKSLKGIYVLVLQLSKDTRITIGAIGEISFQKGTYLYVGSAQNNLLQRVKRHLRKEKSKFWHIDYLLGHEAASVAQVFYTQADKTEECCLANEINKRGRFVAGFGCSDCHCKSHLFQVDDATFLQSLMQPLSLDQK